MVVGTSETKALGSNSPAFNNEAYKNIEIYQNENSKNKVIEYSLVDPSISHVSYFYLVFNIENKNAYYIQLNETETDSVFGIVEPMGDGATLTKIIYNGEERTL